MSNKETKYVYGKGGRIKAAPDPLLIQSAYKHDCSYAQYLMPDLNKADIAYALMLTKTGIIPKDEGKKLLQGLKQLETVNYEEYVDPKYGDIYNSKEVYLSGLIGKTAGWLHIGRPRREAINLAFLMAVRDSYLQLAQHLLDLAKIMANKSKAEIATIMPDFTYLQHANPTTFGHYILTYLFPLLRDFERMQSAYSRLNRSPAGSGSVNGSSLPLDREYLRKLLCFGRISDHSRDGMWQPDIPIELTAVLTLVFSNLNRFTDELQIWNSYEFSMIELPDSLCRTSVIMPQKKNPYPLAYFRGLTNSFLGKLTSSVSYGKVFSGNPDSRIFVYNDLPESLQLANEAIPLIAKVIDEMRINKEVARANVMKGFSYASELSEIISRKYSIDYKTAHKITGNIVNRIISNDLDKLTGEDISATIETFTGKKIDVDANEIIRAIQPENIIEARRTTGGAAPTEITFMLNKAHVAITDFENWLHEEQNKVDYAVLYNEMNELTAQ